MSNAFEAILDVTYSVGETAVCCPFPHKTGSGIEYYETDPSAHVNMEKGVFHCKVCDEGLNEQQFIQRFFGCSYAESEKLKTIFNLAESEFE